MLDLKDLDPTTRPFVLSEVQHDINNGSLYFGKRLTPQGRADFPDLLKQAVTNFDDQWLAAQLAQPGRLETWETGTRKGKPYRKRVPHDANETLAEGEFNRFFARGLCLRAMQEGIDELVVYRAKRATHPRPESERLIGQRLIPNALLADLRANPGADTWLGVPAGPNSGISVCLPSTYRTLSGS